MERDFWILLTEDDAQDWLTDAMIDNPEAEDFPAWPGIRPLWRESLYVSDEPLLPVFTAEAKAHAFAQHVAKEHIMALRVTQSEIHERVFKGRASGHCTVDPTLDDLGAEISVNGLHLR
jgi:hypothetical protein